MRVQAVTAVDAEVYGLPRIRGAEIVAVEPGGPGASAGMQAGDVVLAIDDHQIRDDIDLTGYLARLQPNQSIRMTIWRNRAERVLDATLGEFPHGPVVARVDPPARADETHGLGFTVEPVTDEVVASVGAPSRVGVAIRYVDPAGAAYGVVVGMEACRAARATNRLGSNERCGMIVLSINGERVSSAEDVARIASTLRPGTAVALRLFDSAIGVMVQNYRVGQ